MASANGGAAVTPAPATLPGVHKSRFLPSTRRLRDISTSQMLRSRKSVGRVDFRAFLTPRRRIALGSVQPNPGRGRVHVGVPPRWSVLNGAREWRIGSFAG